MSHDQSCDIFTPLLFEMESELGAGFTKGFSLNKSHQLRTKTDFFHVTKFIEHKSEGSVHINYKISISHTGKSININWLTHLLSPDGYKMSTLTYPFPSLLYKYFLNSYNFRIRHFKSDLHFKRKTKLQCCSNYKH